MAADSAVTQGQIIARGVQTTSSGLGNRFSSYMFHPLYDQNYYIGLDFEWEFNDRHRMELKRLWEGTSMTDRT